MATSGQTLDQRAGMDEKKTRVPSRLNHEKHEFFMTIENVTFSRGKRCERDVLTSCLYLRMLSLVMRPR